MEQRQADQARRLVLPRARDATVKSSRKSNYSSKWYKSYWETPRRLSKDLAAVCGKQAMSRTDVANAIWSYISKKKLQRSSVVKPDALP